MGRKSARIEIPLNWESYQRVQHVMVYLYGLIVFNLPVLSISAWLGRDPLEWYWNSLISIVLSFFIEKIVSRIIDGRLQKKSKLSQEYLEKMTYNRTWNQGYLQIGMLIIAKFIVDLIVFGYFSYFN